MTDRTAPAEAGWFAGIAPDDVEAASQRIIEAGAAGPREWPQLAVDDGFVASEAEYYDRLRQATIHAARQEVRERERADDRQLVHALRAMDDCERTANELAERVSAWGTSREAGTDSPGTGVEYARHLADDGATDSVDARLASLASRVADLANEAAQLRRYVERTAPDVAPNLSAMAGAVLAARLISLAGGLEALARMPSGTVQVLGAEQALFAHLRGDAPSPKHGVIYVHEYVQNTDPEHRGSAARALAGKLTIAARVDHYAGDHRPQLQAELDERIARIRDRTAAESSENEASKEEGS